jgi:two-component sensor histidine kinase
MDAALVREGATLHLSQMTSRTVATTDRAAYIPNVQATTGEREALIRWVGLRAYVTEPLIVAGVLLGTLSFGSRTRDRFNADDLAFFRKLARHVALARQQADVARQLAERELQARQRLAEMETANAELHHRVKNLLTTVQAIGSSTVRATTSLPEFEEAFGGRLKALAKTHDLLVTGARGATSLTRLLRSELDPYDDEAGSRVRLDGPDVVLGSEIAVPLGMAVHELTTNAAKYGALSVGPGSVHVEWFVDPTDSGEQLQLRWIEEGGPAVSSPKRRGFGSQLLERVLGGQFGAKVEREFAPQGLRVRINLLLH